MGYYGGRRGRSNRSWRSRGYGRTSGPSKHTALFQKFGSVVTQIRKVFLALEEDALDELFRDYGAIEVKADGNFDADKPMAMTCPQAIELIKKGSTFTTMVKADGNKSNTGAPLQVFPVETDYLKTKNHKSKRDNLESLPRF